MAAKMVSYLDASLVLKGVEALADAVKVTLGPKGRTIVIEKSFGAPVITKDGLTIAKEIELEGKLENMGAQMVREAASRTSDVAGDGTTTATVLAQVIFREGSKLVALGLDPMEIKRGIDQSVDAVIDQLKQDAKLTTDWDEVAHVGTIAANGDSVAGQLLREALEQVGGDGVVAIEEAKSAESRLDIVDGLHFDRGYLSPYFVTDPDRMEASLEDAYLLLTEQRISNLKALLPILEVIAREQKPLLIIAEDVEGESLATLVVNRLRGTLSGVAVKAPGFGERRKALLRDIAVLTGGQVIEMNRDLAGVTIGDLGRARRIRVDKDNTTIVEGAGTKEAIAARRQEIALQIGDIPTGQERYQLRQRLDKLSAGIAVIRVGASSEVEMKEKKARLEDALHATRAALEEGVVAGGGVALIRARRVLDSLQLTGQQVAGMQIIARAIEEPFRQIVANSGADPASILQVVTEQGGDFGFNAATGQYGNLLAQGVIDPVKVVRAALQNAANVASLMLTTEASNVAELTAQQTVPLAASSDEGILVEVAPRLSPADTGRSRTKLPLGDRPPPSGPPNHPPPSEPPGGGGPPSPPLSVDDSILREPLMELLAPLASGLIVLKVDLRPPQSETSYAIEIKHLPKDWRQVPIVVRLSCACATFEQSEAVILICRDGDSVPCTFVGQLVAASESVGPLEVIARFSYLGGYCGECRQTFERVGLPPSGPPPIALGPASSAESPAVPPARAIIRPGHPAPDLTAYVWHYPTEPNGVLHWHLDLADRHRGKIAGIPKILQGETKLGHDDVERWALDLVDQFANDPNSSRELIEGIGQRIYQVMPSCFKDAYHAVRRELGEFSIQFICDDPFVPWELAQPVEQGHVFPHLMTAHPVGRWISKLGEPPPTEISRGEIVTIAPRIYADRTLAALPAAQDQAEALVSTFHASRIEARKQLVQDVLQGKRQISLLHFAGHGKVHDRNHDLDSLVLEDAELSSIEVNQEKTVLGNQFGTFVFFNACSVGQAGRTFGGPAGWPATFLQRRFGGYLAPISRVWERDAKEFAADFIERVLSRGLPVGKALLELRQESQNSTGLLTPLAYFYFGDVMARFV